MADMKAAVLLHSINLKLCPSSKRFSETLTFAAPAYVPVLRASEPLVGAYASIAELNQLSAPIKGNGGVFVLQPYAKDKLKRNFQSGNRRNYVAEYACPYGKPVPQRLVSES